LTAVHDRDAARQGASCDFSERVAAMSDTQLTTIARLDERLAALKERL
jgi:hypothetical protein